MDDTTSFGPETVKITNLDSTKHYVYAIHHFSGSGSITSTSQAQVKVTFADGSTRNFTAPTSGGMGQGDYWRVFDIVDNKLLPCQQNCLQTAINPRIRTLDSSASDLPWKDDIARDLRPK